MLTRIAPTRRTLGRGEKREENKKSLPKIAKSRNGEERPLAESREGCEGSGLYLTASEALKVEQVVGI